MQVEHYLTIIVVGPCLFVANIRLVKEDMNNSSVAADSPPFTLPFSIISTIISTFGVFGNGMVGMR